MKRRIHIAVVSPSIVVRKGLVSIFKKMSSPGIDVTEIAEMADIPRRVRVIKPDVLIADVSQIGAVACLSLKADIAIPSVKLIAMLTQMTDNTVLRNFDATMSLYDSYDSIQDKIIRLVEDDCADDTRQELSLREKEIIVCVVKGMTNKQIADTLCISAHTVMTHRRNIAAKLSIHSTAGLTIYAIVNKLIELDQIKDAIHVEE